MLPASNQGLGMNMGFPDVCMTPTPAGPIPIPYPNIGMNAMALPFLPTIFMSFIPGHNMAAKPLMTNGDNAGVAHPLCMQPGGTTMGNPRILLTGMPAEHMLVPTYGNNFNDPIGAKIVPSITNVLLSSLQSSAPREGRTQWSEVALETTRRELSDLPTPTLGLTTASVEEGLEVVHVRRDEAAALAGVRPGDLLRALDGVSTQDMEELPLLEPGRPVVLELEREGQALTLSAVWERTPPAVSGELWGERVGRIDLRRFSLRAAAALDAEVERLVRLGARSLVLDLRGSPGGALSAALEAAELFLREGAPVIRMQAPGRSPELVVTREGGRWQGLPLVLLIDDQTASAGEVLAVALQDNRRAALVGQRSFGKGVAESPGGAWASLTRPDGGLLRGRGVEPDLSCEDEAAPEQALQLALSKAS